MKTQIKFPIFTVLFALIVLSCSQEDLSAPEDFKVAKQQVQFDFNTTEEPLNEDQYQFNATISSVYPLVIESDELEVFTYFDHETDTYVEGVVKIGTAPNLEADNGEPCEMRHLGGYNFNPVTKCFEKGIWVIFSDCTTDFISFGNDPILGHIVCLEDIIIPIV